MEKKLIKKRVFEKYFGKQQPKWQDIKNLFDIQDQDLVSIYHDEQDDEWFFIVKREELETNEEYNLRLERNDEWFQQQKEKKHKIYLKLKEQFKKE